MKKIIAIFIFGICLVSKGDCQYRKTVVEGSEWNISYQGLGAWNYMEVVQGDTIVNGNTYQKHIEIPYYDPSQLHLLREDSLAKKIYAIQYDSTTEILLYDFSLVVGDTFTGVNFQMVLDSITDTIFYDICGLQIPPILSIDSPRVFYFHLLPVVSYQPIVWVEGIGSLASLMFHDWQWWGWDYRVLCHYNEFGYRDFHQTSCEIDTCLGPNYGSTSDLYSSEHDIKIYPNPVANELNIEIVSPKIKAGEMFLYDYLGKKIVTHPLDSGITNIDISTLPQGVYWGVFHLKNHRTISKMIVKR